MNPGTSATASAPAILTEHATPDDIKWADVSDEALTLLRSYLRFPTVNDPLRLTPQEAAEEPWVAGNEEDAASWLAEVLRTEGITPELLTAKRGRTSLMACLRSEHPTKLPLVLLSHSDVVPVLRKEWDHDIDPFSATIRDGYLYGRGVLDLKALGIAHLMIFILLHRLRVPLNRDVILLIVADEEAGGNYGAAWLLQSRPELFQCSVVLGEGGFSIQGLWHGKNIHAISVAEKGCIEIECLVDGAGHHAGMPSANPPTARLVSALSRILKLDMPVRVTDTTQALISALIENTPGLRGKLLRLPFFAGTVAPKHLSGLPAVNAMLRDTIALTILESGLKGNLVPGQARAVLNIRLLPGTDPEAMMEKIRKTVADPEVQVRQLHLKLPNACDFRTGEFDALARQARTSKGDLVVPILCPGASDGRHWRYAGVHCYGWVPFPIGASDLMGVHGPNERVSLSAFEWGLQHLYGAVREIVM